MVTPYGEIRILQDVKSHDRMGSPHNYSFIILVLSHIQGACRNWGVKLTGKNQQIRWKQSKDIDLSNLFK